MPGAVSDVMGSWMEATCENGQSGAHVVYGLHSIANCDCMVYCKLVNVYEYLREVLVE